MIIPFPSDRIDYRPRILTECRLYKFQLRPLMDEYRPPVTHRTPTPFGWFLIGLALIAGVRR
jgi:hypothetical protein